MKRYCEGVQCLSERRLDDGFQRDCEPVGGAPLLKTEGNAILIKKNQPSAEKDARMDNATTTNATPSTTDIFNMHNASSATPLSEIAARSASLILIALLSFFGNSLVCVTLYRRPYLLTPSNKLVFSLTTANFVFSLLVLPFVITGSITEQWYFGKVWCAITGFLTLLVMGASMLILAAIACDRYYAIVHPMFYPNIITGFRATAVIIVCWVVAAACAAPPLFGAWSRYEFQPHRCGCMPVWQEGLGFTIFWFVSCFFTPYIMMLICYGCIFKVARTKTRQVHSRVESPSRFPGQNQFFEDNSSNSSDSGSYTEVSDSFPTTRVIGANVTITVEQAPDAKINTQGDANDNSSSANDDSGIMVSENTSPNVANNNHTKENGRKTSENGRKMNENGRMYLPNQVENKESPRFSSRRNSSTTNDFDATSSAQIEAEFQLRNTRKSSNASIISSTSQVIRRTSLAFSAVRYYSNQMKAVFTIAFILGILLVTMGPFVVTALIEARTGTPPEFTNATLGTIPPSPVSRITLSLSTCFMFLTCVYYPLIYGLWNRTVRKEMRNLLCGHRHQDHRQMARKTRILSLTTHIQDLGMSPGLTAAIIGESDPLPFNGNFFRDRHLRSSSRHLRTSKETDLVAAAAKRRHTLHSLSAGSLLPQAAHNNDAPSPCLQRIRHNHNGLLSRLRRDAFEGHRIGVIKEESDQEDSSASRSSQNYTNNSNMRRWRHDYDIKTVSDTVDETAEVPSTSAPPEGGYKMRLQTKDDVLVPVSYDQQQNAVKKFPSRMREKPATSGLLELSSSEVLSNAALSSALLFVGYDHRSRRTMRSERRTVSESANESSGSEDFTDTVANRKVETKTVTNAELAAALGNVPVSVKKKVQQVPNGNAVVYKKTDAENDAIAIITQGRLHGSNLIHLEAGEPTKVRQWSESQFVDFFASSIAYGVVEAGKVEIKEEERPPSRS